MDDNKRILEERVGNTEQVAYARRATMTDGKACGMKIIDIDNGQGLTCTLLESRCLDIARLSYKGINMGFLAKPGLVSPSNISGVSNAFPRYFYAGMLYTCGLSNMGQKSCKNEEALLMHGRIGLTPAENTTAVVDWNTMQIHITGTMRLAALFGQNMVMDRHITISMTDNTIGITDTVTNNSFIDDELMLLYHFNFGHPMLSEDLVLDIKGDVTPRDDVSKKGAAHWRSFEKPTPARIEEVFYHTSAQDDDGLVHAKLINKKLKMGAEITFDPTELPQLAQWKSMASGDYALGIEPATARVDGYQVEKKENRVITLKPGECKTYHLTLALSDLS